MARSAIPDPLSRRHLLEQELAPARGLAIAEAYLESGRVLEAVDFLQRAQDPERLAELRARAIAEGDAFLLRAVCRASGRPPEREEWRALAEAAATAGKERYELDARRQTELEEE
jgi:hypothetical protein